MKLKSYAKVNLFLEVDGIRQDGYHNIFTVFQEIDLFDEIVIRKKKKGVKIICKAPNVPTDERNLVFKAVKFLEKYCGKNIDIEITIKKNIPVGGGLGGGSSNAATTLVGLNRLFKLRLAEIEILKIAKKIGADVPFFIKGGRCVGEGIGDILTQIPQRFNFWIVLITPKVKVSTKEIYEGLKSFNLTPLEKEPHSINSNANKRTDLNFLTGLTGGSKNDIIKTCKNVSKLSEIVDNLYNKLEEITFKKFPEIKRLKKILIKSGVLGSLMSGSGSSVFGIVKDKKSGNKICNRLRKEGHKVLLVKTR